MKALVSIIVILFVVGCGPERGRGTKYFQKKIEMLEADNTQAHEMYENELNEAYQRIDILQGEVDRLRKLKSGNEKQKSEISRLNGEKSNNIAEEPTNELTPDDIVGTYEYITEDSKTNRAIFMNNGAGQHHDLEGQKISFKWKIINEEVQITGNFTTIFCRKETDGRLTKIAEVNNKARTELPEKEQISGKKIK